MIYQTYQTLQQFNVTTGAGIFLYVANTVPLFFPTMLFILFLIAMLGSYYSQKRLSGQGSFLSSFAVASYFVTIVSFIMMLIPNLIDGLTVTICVITSIIATILLLSISK